MGIFDGVAEAKASQDSVYLAPGNYILRIDAVKEGKNRKEAKFVAIEMTVLHVIDKGVHAEDDQGGYKTQAHSVGTSATHMLMVDNDMFLPNFKQFVCGVTGALAESVDSAACDAITGPDQPLAGMFVDVYATNIKTRAGKDFTKVSYRGEVPGVRLAEELDESEIRRFFPDESLADLIAEEAKE